jgi:hypothetical protein
MYDYDDTTPWSAATTSLASWVVPEAEEATPGTRPEIVPLSGEEPPPPSGGTVRDDFGAVTFDNNDGTASWTGDWVEYDVMGAGPSGGNVDIYGGELWMCDQPDSGTQPSLAREVDLSGATTATLSFDFRTESGVDWNDAVVVEVSGDGGNSYTVLETFTGITGATAGTRTYDISGFISANTRIRFRVTNLYGGYYEHFVLDYVQVEYSG